MQNFLQPGVQCLQVKNKKPILIPRTTRGQKRLPHRFQPHYLFLSTSAFSRPRQTHNVMSSVNMHFFSVFHIYLLSFHSNFSHEKVRQEKPFRTIQYFFLMPNIILLSGNNPSAEVFFSYNTSLNLHKNELHAREIVLLSSPSATLLKHSWRRVNPL